MLSAGSVPYNWMDRDRYQLPPSRKLPKNLSKNDISKVAKVSNHSEEEEEETESEFIEMFEKYLKCKSVKKDIMKWLTKNVPESYWDRTKNSVLHFAACQGNIDVLKHLISIGYNHINFKNADGVTPLMLAIERNSYEVVRYLLKMGSIHENQFFRRQYGPLHLAAEKRSIEMVKILIDSGANVNAVDDQLNTPLHVLFSDKTKYPDRTPIFSELLAAGAQLDPKNCRSETPFHLAIAARCPKLVLTLVDLGVRVNGKNDRQQSALHYACRANDYDLVKYFLQRFCFNSAVNESDADGKRPLHHAARAGSYKIVRLLLERGAVVNAVDAEGVSALSYAIQSHDSLQTTPSDHSSSIPHVDPNEQQCDLCELLIDHGAIARSSTKKCDPLFEAVQSENCKLFDMIEPHLGTTRAFDCLQTAIASEQYGILRKLILHGIVISNMDFINFGLILYNPNNITLHSTFEKKLEVLSKYALKKIRVHNGRETVVKAFYKFVLQSEGEHMCSFLEKIFKAKSEDNSPYNILDFLDRVKALGLEKQVLKSIETLVRDGKYSINADSREGSYLLKQIITKGDCLMLKFLLKLRVHNDEKKYRMKLSSPLQAAIKANQADCAQLLLLDNVNFNTPEDWREALIATDSHVPTNYHIARHIIKQIALNEPENTAINTSEGYQVNIDRFEGGRDFYQACRAELKSLQKLQIRNSVTLLDVLKNPRLHYRNSVLFGVLRREISYTTFPIYHRHLVKLLDELAERHKSVGSAVSSLLKLFQRDADRHFPLIYDNIFKHLSNRDLCYLGLAFSDE